MDVRKDFPFLKNNIIYLDNGATTLKPQCVIDEIVNYYSNYSANAHRGDYDISHKVNMMYEGTREKVKNFINADSEKEIIFTKNSTESLNMIVFGFFKNILKKGDEILLTKSEHASNILPWFELCKEIGCKIKYIPLDNKHRVTISNFKKTITEKTKVVSISHITNVIGDIRPIKEITALAHKNNIYVCLDGSQSVGHMKVDIKDLDVDFFAFSAHKMCGPTGVGVLYGKYKYLEKLKPQEYGGGMNASFDTDGTVSYSELPYRLEAGTPNIAGVIGLGAALDYLNNIGMQNIMVYEQNLREYALAELSKIDNIILYNKDTESGIIAFNLDGVFSQDTAYFLNQHNICVRAGSHCAKILKDELSIKNTCRISLYFYNTKEEIDKLIEVLKRSKDIFNIII
ncbi:MAG: SufS family cysteine desulfurase [Bacilli bacterium]|nr:SufS family cysteine desulfurase [Bacilli bacterium]